MKALLIRQPWAWAILHVGKDVENRSWRTSYRGPLAVHASRTVDRESVEFLRRCGFAVPDELPTGCVVGEVRLVDCLPDSLSEWAVPGQWHWLLADPVSFTTLVPCWGSLGLFTVPGPP